MAISISPWSSGSSLDTGQIAHLLTELGYPVDPEELEPRLLRFDGLRSSLLIELLLARESEGNSVVGFIQVSAVAVGIESDSNAEILALVVDSRCRGQRIGEHLVAAAESWALERGCSSVRVRTNVVRLDTHRFYERLGFDHVKTQKTYTKSLEID